MTIEELKTGIENNTLKEIRFIFKLEDYSSEFIVDQYIDYIAKERNLERKRISDLKEIGSSGFIVDNNLYVYKTDKLDGVEVPNNCIIICNKTKDKDAILIPKLEPWQFVEYLQNKVPGMDKADLDWLMTQYETTDSRVTQINYFRLDNDLDKVAIFDPAVQSQIFDWLYKHGEYDTISNLTVFDLTNALIRKDRKTALEVLKVFPYIDSAPHVWILSILVKGIRNIIGIQTGINTTPESLGISDKQFYAVKKRNCGYYTLDKLIKIYEMLTNLEYQYKFGGLTQENLADYIVVKMLEGD